MNATATIIRVVVLCSFQKRRIFNYSLSFDPYLQILEREPVSTGGTGRLRGKKLLEIVFDMGVERVGKIFVLKAGKFFAIWDILFTPTP